MKRFALATSALMTSLVLAIPSIYAQTASATTAFLPNPVQFLSTVPSNGDVNPYGVAVVPANFPTGGLLNPGDILVSNFNNSQNLQGTGTTIVQITGGKQQLFYQAAAGSGIQGLSGGLVITSSGYVVVGSFPTSDGTCGTAQPGSLVVLDKNANVVTNWTNSTLVNGPWGMAIDDRGAFTRIYIANALSGTVSRIDFWTLVGSPVITANQQIGSGYAHRCDPAALVVAPGGLYYNKTTDLLYVASADDNAVFSISNASTRTSDGGTGTMVYSDATHLHGALMLGAAPNGDLLVSNADVINSDPTQPSEIVEFTTAGQFVKELSVDPNQGGSFGLFASAGQLAAVDDNTSGLFIWTIPQ
jgi:hypothetical protein